MFTHFGISGPVVFELSAHITYASISEKTPFSIKIQIDETKDYNFRNNELLKHQKESPNKKLKTILWYYFPSRFVDVFVFNICKELWKELEYIEINSLTKVARKVICRLLSEWFELHLSWTKPWDEFVIAWWINTEEINTKTMESKINPWLYFVGEILNIDGVTGWYNLQAAWCTGTAAANNICNKS